MLPEITTVMCKRPKPGTLAGVPIYDWDGLFRRRRFTLARGVDYRCTPFGMKQQVRNAAAARGLYVSVLEPAGNGVLHVTVRRHKVRGS